MKTKVVKTYHAHQASSFFMGLFALLFAGSFALLFFFPAYTLTVDSVTTEYTGYEILLLGAGEYLAYVFPDLPLDNAKAMLSSMSAYEGKNVIFSTFAGFHNWVALGISALGLLALVLAAIVVILGLFWFIRGRIFIPKATITFAHWSNGLYDACVGLFYAYLFIFGEMSKEGATPVTVAMTTYPFIILGIQAVVLIFLRIIHRFCYKNRVYEKKQKSAKPEKPQQAVANPTNAPAQNQNQPAAEPEMVPVYNKGIPSDITQIGDNSFAGDDALTNAVIPEGINFLGSNAFANCHNLETVTIPVTCYKIGANCFYNTPHLKTINYTGTKEDWRTVRRGSNWLVGSGTDRIHTRDGDLVVNPNQ